MSRDYSSPIPASLNAADTAVDHAAIREDVSALFASYAPAFTRYLRGKYGDEHAEELAQEAFLRLYDVRVKGGQIDNPESWLIVVARRLAVSRWRKTGRHEERQRDFATVVDEPSLTPSAEAIFLNRERLAAIRDAEHRLTDLEHGCLVMRARGHTFEEIGQRFRMDFRRAAEVVGRAIRRLNAAQD